MKTITEDDLKRVPDKFNKTIPNISKTKAIAKKKNRENAISSDKKCEPKLRK